MWDNHTPRVRALDAKGDPVAESPEPKGAGSLDGRASHGQGGSFSLDSKTLQGVGGLDGMAQKLRGGGFDNRIALRSRAGDLALSEVKDGNGQQSAALRGREVEIAADGGSLSLGGWIDADGKGR